MSSQSSLCSRPKTLVMHMLRDDFELECVQYTFGEKHFIAKDFLYILEEMLENGKCVLKLSVVPSCNSEWELMYQLRVKTGFSSSSLQIVDETVVQFSPTSNGISFEVLDNIKVVKIELKTINEFNLICPKFDQGDVILRLNDRSYIKTYKSLIALTSETLRETLSLYPSTNCLDLQHLPRSSVVQFLYRLYPNRRTLNLNIDDFAIASVALCARLFIEKLSDHICSSSFQPISPLERLNIALALRLVPAIKGIVLKLVKSGEWDLILEKNPDFLQNFPIDVYNTLIQPIITQKSMGDRKHTLEFDLFSDNAASDPYNKKVLFLETAFYINEGVLSTNGTKSFEKLPDGSLVAKFSKRLQRECALAQCAPGEILRHLLIQMYPGGSPIPLEYERAALVFCFDHKWMKMIQILEQAHMRNPCTSKENFYLNLFLADELELRNLLRTCMLYAEGSCNKYAHQLIGSPDFYKFSEKTRRLLVDHVFCGWSVEGSTNEKQTNRLAIRVPSFENRREIGFGRGGPKGYGEDQHTDFSFDN